jgi:MFS family permease
VPRGDHLRVEEQVPGRQRPRRQRHREPAPRRPAGRPGGAPGQRPPGEQAGVEVVSAALVALLRHEPRRDEPLIELRFFRSVAFSSAIGTSVSAFAAFGGLLFVNTLYLQETRGLSPLQAGLVTVPMALMTVFASPLSGRIVGRRGPRIPLLMAGVLMTAGGAMLLGIDAGTPIAQVVAAYVVFGLGFGFVNAPITNAAVSGMPRAQAGVAAAIATTSRQVGQTLGVAVIGAIAVSHVGAARWTLTACAALVLLLAFVATARR